MLKINIDAYATCRAYFFYIGSYTANSNPWNAFTSVKTQFSLKINIYNLFFRLKKLIFLDSNVVWKVGLDNKIKFYEDKWLNSRRISGWMKYLKAISSLRYMGFEKI